MDFLEKFESLPVDVQDLFASNKPRLALERACFLYNVPEEDIAKMALPIRDFFLKDISLTQLPLVVERELRVKNSIAFGIAYEINAKIFSELPFYFSDSVDLLKQWSSYRLPPIISEEKARRRLIDIEPWIIKEEKEEREVNMEKNEEQKKFKTLSLNEALTSYPRLAEQGVTTNQLKMQYSSEPARPSIKNWIKDFHDAMGAGKHSPIDRGNFLFHSENGKRLTAFDRQKLAVILKSLDEQTPLKIDEEAQMVIFDVTEEQPNQSSVISHQSSAEDKTRTQRMDSSIPLPALLADRRFAQNDNAMDAMRAMPKNEMQNIGNAQTPLPIRQTVTRNLEQGNVLDSRFRPPRVDERSFPRVEAGGNDKDKADEFFSVPGSKPPIGSDEFHVENADMPRVDNRFDTDHMLEASEPSINEGLSTDSKFGAVEIRETRKNVAPTFSSPNNISFSSPQKLPTEHETSLEAPSRTVLLGAQGPSSSETLMKKTWDAEPRDVLDAPRPIISCVQDLTLQQPARSVAQPQKAQFHIAPENKPENKSADIVRPAVSPRKEDVYQPKTISNAGNNPSQPMRKPQTISPYHIGPSKNDYRDSDSINSIPRVNGNVVDLS